MNEAARSLVFPAEWHPQEAVMLTWPHARTDWAWQLEETERVYVALAAAICRYEKLRVACHDAGVRAHVDALLRQAGLDPARYALYLAPSNDTWVRDHGPISVYAGGKRALLDFTFNGWGNKYPAQLDNRITARLHAAGAFGASPCRSVDLVLEGGALESDGQGTLLSTLHCMTSPQRNPRLDLPGLEAALRGALGVERFLWLGHGALEGDDTDSHIDTLARFCDPHTIAYVRCDDAQDSHYPEMQAMAAELAAFRQADGTPYRLVPLPWPRARYNAEGRRLPATYANFLIIDGAVLVPTYDDAADAATLAALAGCFPGRDIVGIPCLPLIRQNGSLHCVTMQIPRDTPQA